MVPYPGWRAPGNQRRTSVVCRRRDHDELPSGERQGQSVQYFLGDIPVWVVHRSNNRSRSEHQSGWTERSIHIDVYRKAVGRIHDVSRLIRAQAFLVVVVIGIASSALVLPPNRVIRSDGTIVKLDTSTKVKDELMATLRLLKDWRLVALLPMFFASMFYYPYLGSVNTTVFDSSTRALNATLEAAGSIIGALMMGYLVLDVTWLPRRRRGYFGLAVTIALTLIIWSVGLSWQVTFTRHYKIAHNDTLINYKDANYKGKGALFFFCTSYPCFSGSSQSDDATDYFLDSCYRALLYWTMSAHTNDPFKLARFAGVYNAIQSVGAAVAFGVDAALTPLLNEHLASWMLLIVSFPLVFLVLRTVKETSYEDEMVVYADDVKSGEDKDLEGHTGGEKAEVVPVSSETSPA